MRSFADKDGRVWNVEINTLVAKRVRTLTGFELFKIIENEGKAIYELRDNVELLVDVVYAICQPQVDACAWKQPYAGRWGALLWRFGIGRKAVGRKDELFGIAMGGEAVDLAWDAIITEMIDFFSGGRRRKLLAAAVLETTTRTDRQRNLARVDLPQPTAGASCLRWRAVSACCRGLSRFTSFASWMNRDTTSERGSRPSSDKVASPSTTEN